MADMLARGMQWLTQQRTEHMSQPVTYVRGADSVTLPATIGRTEFEIDDGQGLLQKYESRDFLVQTADLVLDGSATLPERGDLVRETQGATTYVYEVLAPGQERAWRYSDPYRQALRIHTKHIDTETP